MPFVIDTNVWIDAAETCEYIRDPLKREVCESKRREALEAIEQAKGDCYIPKEVKDEIKVNVRPRVAARAKRLMSVAGCEHLTGDPAKVSFFEVSSALTAKHDPLFRDRCTSRFDIERGKKDWRIIAKAASLSERESKPVVVVSSDRNFVDSYCAEKYAQLAEELFDGAEIIITHPSRVKEIKEAGHGVRDKLLA